MNKPDAPPSAENQSNESKGISWYMPPIRIGGSVSYVVQRNSSDGQDTRQTGLAAALNASINTYIWQPWFAQLSGSLGLTTATDSGGAGSDAVMTKTGNVALTGSGQLTVLPLSKFPFEAHFQRNDSRVSTDFAQTGTSAYQRYGFTQRYFQPKSDLMLAWDRSEQSSAENGLDIQDTLQLRMSVRLEEHRLQLAGDRVTNWHEVTSESGAQNSLTLQHSFAPVPTISVDSMANVSRSDYRLLSGRNDTRLFQLSTNAAWRPEDSPLSINVGARMFALGTDAVSFTGFDAQSENRLFNANGNLGLTYEVSRFTTLNASANVNMTENNGVKTYTTSQTASASYRPDSIAWGAFRYNWGTSASASNQTGGTSGERQLTLQFSHGLSRSIKLEGDSSISIDVGQGLSSSLSNRASSGDSAEGTKQLSHTGAVSWNMAQKVGSTVLRLSVSDSRALDGQQDFFQLINFQASSNLPTGGSSSWTGNLTIQAVRQGNNAKTTELSKGFVASSSGSISYQNQRFLGIRQLRLASDLRLNSDGLLPAFGTGAEQEVVAWDNRLIYSIGRTRFQASMQLSTTSSEKTAIDTVTGKPRVDTAKRTNKSIMFSVTRSFGN